MLPCVLSPSAPKAGVLPPSRDGESVAVQNGAVPWAEGFVMLLWVEPASKVAEKAIIQAVSPRVLSLVNTHIFSSFAFLLLLRMMLSVRIPLQLKFAKSSAVGESVCGGAPKRGVFLSCAN